MRLESVIGWLILLSLLAALSACLVLPPLHVIDRKFPLGRWRRSMRRAAVLAGGIGLWYAIPFLIHYARRHF